MPFDGAGTFAVYTPGTPYANGTTIDETVVNAVQSDFATGLTNCVTRDGQSPPTANLPMGGFKITGLAAGSAAGNSLRYEQALLLSGNAGSVAPTYLGGTVYPFYSGLIFGLTLSTAGSSSTMSVAAGVASDPSTTAPYLMRLASSIGKTTSAWAVGTGNGGLDTGAIANSTWYHFYLISRTDTGVVDVLFSTSATSPTMPANYTQKRRIGAGKTDGSGNWTAFTQDGDYFRWSASVLDINVTNPGTSAVLRTLTVPTGVNVTADFNIYVSNSGTASAAVQVSDPAATDEAASASAAPLAMLQSATAGGNAFANLKIRTNTSAQVRVRGTSSDANEALRIATLGWIDRRGRDA